MLFLSRILLCEPFVPAMCVCLQLYNLFHKNVLVETQHKQLSVCFCKAIICIQYKYF